MTPNLYTFKPAARRKHQPDHTWVLFELDRVQDYCRTMGLTYSANVLERTLQDIDAEIVSGSPRASVCRRTSGPDRT